ncbi:MAG: hypothetical protein EU541_05290 [Promethearchaeota archaeon]|nr:MAG: hypothetical protein EU541_05290 [Candidatus Lokiarchaeota archaeon]
MRINKISNESTEVVKGKLSDIIYFQQEGGKLMYIKEMLDSLSRLSSVVVLRGDEPGAQYEELVKFIKQINDKKIILETSDFNRDLHNMCDKVVFIFKTFDMVHENLIEHINNHLDIYLPLVVVGHEDFNMKSFETLCRILDVLYVRFYDDCKLDLSEYSEIAKKHNTKLIELDKISL